MSEAVIYIVSNELSASSAAWENAGYAGGFVSCAIFANSIIEAIEKCEAALKQDGYDVLICDGAWLYNSDDYADHSDVVEAAKALSVDHDVEYGNFNTYGH